LLAHAGAVDESLALLLLTAGLWTGWAVVSRVRGTGFPGMPVGAAWGLGVLAVALMVSALIVPRALFPRTPVATPSLGPGARPSSTAALAIDRPDPGEDATGSELNVVMTLEGGTIVEASDTRLTPDTGHIHLSLDGEVVSMTYGLVQVVDLRGLAPGEHTLEAEYVAADHGPFDPRVTYTITFRTGAGGA
jgi:hypothetical protein